MRLVKLKDTYFLGAINDPISQSNLRQEGLRLPYYYIELIQDLVPYAKEFSSLNLFYLEYLRRLQTSYGDRSFSRFLRPAPGFMGSLFTSPLSILRLTKLMWRLNDYSALNT